MIPKLFAPKEEYLPLSAARELLRGRGGRPPSMSTVYKWSRVGCQPSADVPAVVLQVAYLGRDLVTKREWIEEFEQARRELHVRRPRVAASVANRSAEASTRRARERMRRRVAWKSDGVTEAGRVRQHCTCDMVGACYCVVHGWCR